MNSEFKTILKKILTLIDYKEDKETFVNEFINLCVQKTLIDYQEMLPEERKKHLQQIFQESDQTS